MAWGWVEAMRRTAEELLAVIVAGEDSTGTPQYANVKLYDNGGASPPVMQLSDGTTLVEVDNDSKGLVAIDAVHRQVHRARSFHYSEVLTAIADGNSAIFRVTVGAQEAHLIFSVSSTQQTVVSFFEGTTFSAPGTGVVEKNHNRRSSRVSTVAVLKSPTINVAGTTLEQIQIPGGTTFKGSVGGEVRRGGEWVLKENTEYCIQATNDSGGDAADIGIAIEWYEPEAP